MVCRSWYGSRIFIPDNFNAEPGFRIYPGEGRELMVVYEFPWGNTKHRFGDKVIRDKNSATVLRSAQSPHPGIACPSYAVSLRFGLLCSQPNKKREPGTSVKGWTWRIIFYEQRVISNASPLTKCPHTLLPHHPPNLVSKIVSKRAKFWFSV